MMTEVFSPLALHESGHLKFNLLVLKPGAIVSVTHDDKGMVTHSDTGPANMREFFAQMVAGCVVERLHAGNFEQLMRQGGWESIMSTEVGRFDLAQLKWFESMDESLNEACVYAAEVLEKPDPELIRSIEKIKLGQTVNFRRNLGLLH